MTATVFCWLLWPQICSLFPLFFFTFRVHFDKYQICSPFPQCILDPVNCTPNLWLCYVNDILEVVNKDRVEIDKSGSIKFTFELESEGKLPFLDLNCLERRWAWNCTLHLRHLHLHRAYTWHLFRGPSCVESYRHRSWGNGIWPPIFNQGMARVIIPTPNEILSKCTIWVGWACSL